MLELNNRIIFFFIFATSLGPMVTKCQIKQFMYPNPARLSKLFYFVHFTKKMLSRPKFKREMKGVLAKWFC